MSQSLEQPQFGWLDGFILAAFVACGLVMAVLNDRVFFNLLPSLASHQAPWGGLPDWVADLELPAKRVQWDFLAFLSVVSLGVGLVIVRGRRSGVRNGLPGPGVAAGVTAALVVIEQTVERLCLAAQDGLLVWPAFIEAEGDRAKSSAFDERRVATVDDRRLVDFDCTCGELDRRHAGLPEG